MSLDVYLENYCDHCKRSEQVFEQNYTHNANKMADAAGLYACVWRPDEHGMELAEHIIELLKAGIELMKSDPERFKALEPANGWGSYDSFVPWLEKYLEACEANPKARIRVSR